MKFRTQVLIPPSETQWTHRDSFVMLGSCFSSEIGSRLRDNLFPVSINPLGTCFNPLSVSKILINAIESQPFAEETFFENLGLWRNFHIHSTLASSDKKTALQSANQAIRQLHDSLAGASCLVVTLGTAWSYQAKETREDVGHNHKLPKDHFTRRLLDVDEIAETLGKTFKRLLNRFPNLRIAQTVSPVRHTRDGLRENNLSKSALLLATSKIESISKRISYFPSYEIVMDELRDYRFYADDLIHPSKMAVEYIWKKLSESHFDQRTQELCKSIASVRSSIEHRPSHPYTDEYRLHISGVHDKLDELERSGLPISQLREAANATIS